MNLGLSKNIKNMNLDIWEKIFVSNYYDGKNNVLPQGEKKYDQIRNDINKYFEKLCELKKEDLALSSDSQEVIREYDGELKAMEMQGNDISSYKRNKEIYLEAFAKGLSDLLYEEYKHIVDFLKNEDYPVAFKAMMLRETLTQTYKIDCKNGKKQKIVKKRELNQSISEHMILNEITLNIINSNIENYSNFSELYFLAIEEYNKEIIQESKITLDGVDTYGKGKWMKFEGKTSNSKMYFENAHKLSALVKDTPWCTKNLALQQLAGGDFYVFVDNEDKPHVAVRMEGNSIGEVRGIANEGAQELENDYRDVAISFLEKNKEIRNGKEWLEKEAWNKKLLEYRAKIENGTFDKSEVEDFIENVYKKKDYKSHGAMNSNLKKLREMASKIAPYIAEYYGVSAGQIVFNDVYFSKKHGKKCPYAVIFGNVSFSEENDIKSLGDLKFISGSAWFKNSKIESLEKVECIGENADFEESGVIDLGNLKRIGGRVSFKRSRIEKLGNLIEIGENAYFSESSVTDLGNLIRIGENAYFQNCGIKNLGNLVEIGGNADFAECSIESLNNLTRIGGNADFREASIRNFGKLEYIGGDANFYGAKIFSLYNMRTIGKNANFYESFVSSLGKLENIFGNATFKDSCIIDIGNVNIAGDNDLDEKCKSENLKRIQWLNRMLMYDKKIESNTFEESEVENLLKDLFFDVEYSKYRYSKNSYCKQLKNQLFKIKDKIAQYYNCSEDEICFGDMVLEKGNRRGKKTNQPKTCPYKIILGDANFSRYHCKNLGELKIVGGYVVFHKNNINTGKIEVIGASAIFRGSQITTLANIEKIGGAVDLTGARINSLGNLKIVGRKLLLGKKIQNLDNLEYIGEDVDFSNTNVENIGNVSYIGGFAEWGDKEYLKIQYEANKKLVNKKQSTEEQRNDLMEIAMHQEVNTFFSFLDEESTRKSVDAIPKNNREEI